MQLPFDHISSQSSGTTDGALREITIHLLAVLFFDSCPR